MIVGQSNHPLPLRSCPFSLWPVGWGGGSHVEEESRVKSRKREDPSILFRETSCVVTFARYYDSLSIVITPAEHHLSQDRANSERSSCRHVVNVRVPYGWILQQCKRRISWEFRDTLDLPLE